MSRIFLPWSFAILSAADLDLQITGPIDQRCQAPAVPIDFSRWCKCSAPLQIASHVLGFTQPWLWNDYFISKWILKSGYEAVPVAHGMITIYEQALEEVLGFKFLSHGGEGNERLCAAWRGIPHSMAKGEHWWFQHWERPGQVWRTDVSQCMDLWHGLCCFRQRVTAAAEESCMQGGIKGKMNCCTLRNVMG